MRLALYLTLCTAGVVFEVKPQTKTDATKPQHQPKKETKPVQGFAVAPMILTDEGCARDYVRAFQTEGVELRKRLIDLETYRCLDTTAKAIFAGVSTERKDFAVQKDAVAYFRHVLIKFDPERTKAAVGGRLIGPPEKASYFGWIPDENFYAVTPEAFDLLIAEKKIPLRTR